MTRLAREKILFVNIQVVYSEPNRTQYILSYF